MRYFLLKTDFKYQYTPQVIGWHSKIDVRKINRENEKSFSDIELLFIDESLRTVFTDVITFPFLMVSEQVRKVIALYEPYTIFKKIVLLDRVNKKKALYYMPILEKVKCLDDTSKLNLDSSVIKKCILQYSAIKNKGIFFIDGVNKQYTVARLDLVESLFRRRVKGVGLDMVEIKE